MPGNKYYTHKNKLALSLTVRKHSSRLHVAVGTTVFSTFICMSAWCTRPLLFMFIVLERLPDCFTDVAIVFYNAVK